jgi:kumamolisin
MTAVRSELPGSERIPLPGASVVQPVPSSSEVAVTVYVRRNPNGAVPPEESYTTSRLADRRYLTREEAAGAYGAHEADLDAVRRFAEAHDLRVVGKPEPAARRLRLAGTALSMQRAFEASLSVYDHPAGRYRGRTGPLTVPAELEGIVVGVLGLDNRRVGRSYLRSGPRNVEWAHGVLTRAAGAVELPANAYFPPTVARLYDYPQGGDGTGQCVAILVFNGQLMSTGLVARGGYDRRLLQGYFENVLGQRMPAIADVTVHGPGNVPGEGSDQLDVTGEVLLDMCVVGSVAPGARLVMYFTEFTEQGWVDAITSAVTDRQNRPSVVSCSYGNPEDDARRGLWTPMAVGLVDEALRQAAAQGMTIFCASGDNGSSDEPGAGAGTARKVHADYPASSAWVTGCGGTKLVSSSGRITDERVWNDGPAGGASGGGISALFEVPAYQSAAGLNPQCAGETGHHGRGVPDVAGLADPETPLVVAGPGGRLQGAGGTSAAAPMWAALAALLNQQLPQPVGFFNPALYGCMSSGVLRDIVRGDNGAYRAQTGWDACTGLGSPCGSKILAALTTGCQRE